MLLSTTVYCGLVSFLQLVGSSLKYLRFKARASGSTSISLVVKIHEDSFASFTILMWLWLLKGGKC